MWKNFSVLLLMPKFYPFLHKHLSRGRSSCTCFAPCSLSLMISAFPRQYFPSPLLLSLHWDSPLSPQCFLQKICTSQDPLQGHTLCLVIGPLSDFSLARSPFSPHWLAQETRPVRHTGSQVLDTASSLCLLVCSFTLYTLCFLSRKSELSVWHLQVKHSWLVYLVGDVG